MRRHHALAVIAILALGSGRASAGALAESGPNTRMDPIVVVHGASAEEAERVDVALARFRKNGLKLPDIDIVFVPDDDACNGNLGLFQALNKPWTLTVCSDFEFVVTHELAHAWVEAHLDEQAQTIYTTARGLESWNDRGSEWADKGIEDAAFIIQQNLMQTISPRMSRTWRERMTAYELLTGQGSPLLAGSNT